MQALVISLLTDFHIILCSIFILAAWKWGDWKNYKTYYPTILFFIVFDFYYGYITYNYPLWQFESPVIKSVICDIITNFIIFPATILIYLPYMVKTKYIKKKLTYMLCWIAIYMCIEVIALNLGYIFHSNGWSIWWSLVINVMLFPFMWLHHYKPLYPWVLSLIFSVVFLWYFKFPIESIK